MCFEPTGRRGGELPARSRPFADHQGLQLLAVEPGRQAPVASGGLVGKVLEEQADISSRRSAQRRQAQRGDVETVVERSARKRPWSESSRRSLFEAAMTRQLTSRT